MRENASSADNQQERPFPQMIPSNIGWYLAGFTDGEGSFNVSTVNRNQDFKSGWKISLSFNVSQKDETVLLLLKEVMSCGSLRKRKDGVTYYEVRRIDDLKNIVIPFFERFTLKSELKRKQFIVFCEVVSLVAQKQHLTTSGLRKILTLRQSVPVGRKRKYTIEQIISTSR